MKNGSRCRGGQQGAAGTKWGLGKSPPSVTSPHDRFCPRSAPPGGSCIRLYSSATLWYAGFETLSCEKRGGASVRWRRACIGIAACEALASTHTHLWCSTYQVHLARSWCATGGTEEAVCNRVCVLGRPAVNATDLKGAEKARTFASTFSRAGTFHWLRVAPPPRLCYHHLGTTFHQQLGPALTVAEHQQNLAMPGQHEGNATRQSRNQNAVIWIRASSR